jgi:hypothetical protein
MQYAFLIYGEDGVGPQPGQPEFDAYMAGYNTCTETFKSDGAMLAGEALVDVSNATSVRIRSGKTESMDGPFAETKERLGGFYILDCENLDAAIKYAEMIPTVEHGTIEIRPVMIFEQ